MLTENFYDILDSEIDAIVTRYKGHPDIAKYKDINQKKSYAFLVWFLEFYGRVSQFKNYITNGSEDASCDIIFDRVNPQGNIIFYVVQVKWFNRKNALGNIGATEVKKSLNDFETIIRGDKQKGRNKKFNESHRALLDHLNKNGKVKFILLALARENDDYKDNVVSFNKRNGPNSSMEVIDIERIKRDYIDLEYKEIKKESPLEMHEAPDYSKITLRIERFAGAAGKGDIIKTSSPYRAYVVMVKPRTIYELFKTYGFLLFYRNVRNPLPESNYNKQIANTLEKEPEMFWYFNNGITAISRIIPEIGNEAREIEITGLQVINGAQTVYTIYRTYEDALPAKREVMDKYALIMLRLVDSSNEPLNKKITRYTNSQNPMIARDFHANDDVQVRLQRVSFASTYWYEKRREEFRHVPGGIYVVENLTLAAAYLAFFMEDVHGAVINNHLIFISRDIDREGLYETVFSKDITFEDMLASYLQVEKILDFIHPNFINREPGKRRPVPWDFNDPGVLLALAIAPLFKLVSREYLSLKLNEDAGRINLTQYILKNRFAKNTFENILMYIVHLLKLFDRNGKINLKVLEGREAARQLVDIVYRKKTNEKLELLVDIRRMGVEFFEQEDPDEFLSSLVNVIPPGTPEIKAPNVIKLMNDALGLRREAKYDTALLLFENMDGMEPGNWYIYKEWGITCKETGDYDNARKKLQKALELTDSHKNKAGIYTELGVVCRENRMESEALAAFEKAENLDGDNADLYDKWAYLYYIMGQHGDAMSKIARAVKLDENNDAYKWKLEFYSKKFTDKTFDMGLAKFIALKREEKSSSPFGNDPDNFDRFVKHHKPKEIIEGEIRYVSPNLGILVALEFNVVGLIHKSRLPANFDVSGKLKAGKKIKVLLLHIKYDRHQVSLDIVD